jgi:hypothetical protein
VTLTAVADAQSSFVEWSGACAGQIGSVCTTTLAQSRTVSARFVKRRVTLKLVLAGTGAGSLEANSEVPCTLTVGQMTATCLLGADVGTLVTYKAQAVPGSLFTGFGGDCAGVAPCSIVASKDLVVSTRFERQVIEPMRIAVEFGGDGGGRITAPEGVDCQRFKGLVSGPCTAVVPAGAPVTLTATPDERSVFVRWEGDCAGQESQACTVTMSANRFATAVFKLR